VRCILERVLGIDDDEDAQEEVLINKLREAFVVAACSALGIEAGPFPVSPPGPDEPPRLNRFDPPTAHQTLVAAWFAQCPLGLRVDKTYHELGFKAVVYVTASLTERSTVTGGRHLGSFGPGVDQRRMTCFETTTDADKTALARVLASLVLTPKLGPPHRL
jgi:hypothetical protein